MTTTPELNTWKTRRLYKTAKWLPNNEYVQVLEAWPMGQFLIATLDDERYVVWQESLTEFSNWATQPILNPHEN